MSEGISKALTELLEQTIEVMIQRLGGPVFGKIETFDQATDRASVTPLVPLWVDGELVQAPKLPSVPVLWQGSTAHRITWPLPAGSIVKLAPLGCDHSQWLTSGTPNVAPSSTRRLSLSDLVALPLAPSPMSSPPLAASYDATWAVMWGLWIVGSSVSPDFVALAGKVLTELGKIETAISAHTHAAGTLLDSLGMPCTGATAAGPTYTKASVAAAKLKAE